MSSDPIGSRRSGFVAGCAAFVFVLSLSLLLVRMSIPREWGDEGYFANAALRILDGQVIYRDFQHNYPPGRMYALALLIKLFGQDLAVVRIFWCVLHALAVSVSLLVARRLMPFPFALAAAGAVLLNSAHQNKSTELLAAGAVLLVIFRVVEGRTSDGAAGAWLGSIGLFRHDTAAVGIGLYVLAIGLRAWVDTRGRPGIRQQVLARLKRAWPFAVGLCLAVVPFASYLAIEGALGNAIRELVFSGFLANRSLALPFPALVREWSLAGIWQGIESSRGLYYVPIVIYALSLAIAVRRLGRSDRSITAIPLLVTCLQGMALFAQVAVRTDPGHLAKAYVPAHILALFLVWNALGQGAAAARARRLPAAAGLFLLAAMAAAMPIRQLVADSLPAGSLASVLCGSAQYASVETPHGKLTFPLRRAARFQLLADTIVRRSDPRSEEYLVAFPAGATFNFLFGHRNPLRYDVLRPGELGGNDPALLQEILGRIARTRPRFMVHVKERTNSAFARSILHYVVEQGYEGIPAGRLTLFIRPEDGASSAP